MTRRAGDKREFSTAVEIRVALIVGALVAGCLLFGFLTAFRAVSVVVAVVVATAGGIALGVMAAGVRPVRKAIAWVVITAWIVAISGV